MPVMQNTLPKGGCYPTRAAASKKGLTLIEVLAVLAVIALLSSMAMPSLGYVRQRADRAKASSTLHQLALGYLAVLWQHGYPQPIQADNMDQLMQQMAEHGHIHDPQLWFLSADPRAPRPDALPPCVVKPDGQLWDGLDPAQTSFCVAIGVDPNAPASLTPILWTRGLGDNGSWQDGVYGAQGGFVAFLDGHVQWYKTLGSGKKLLRYGTAQVTLNIQEALPPGAQVLPQ